MKTEKIWQENLKQGDTCLAFIRHQIDGSKNRKDVVVAVVENHQHSQTIIAVEIDKTYHTIDYNELSVPNIPVAKTELEYAREYFAEKWGDIQPTSNENTLHIFRKEVIEPFIKNRQDYIPTNINWELAFEAYQIELSKQSEAERRYPVKNHSNPIDSPYIQSQRSFLEGVKYGQELLHSQSNDRMKEELAINFAVFISDFGWNKYTKKAYSKTTTMWFKHKNSRGVTTEELYKQFLSEQSKQ